MSEKPIIFSGEMVRAILDGRKTQTRRVIKPQPHAGIRESVFVPSGLEDGHGREIKTPYRPDDRLWVREAWAKICNDEHSLYSDDYKCPEGCKCEIQYKADHPGCRYPADWPNDCGGGPDVPKWRPSIHMPRWASRITLDVVDVRVERVQDISEEDAMAEGAQPFFIMDAADFIVGKPINPTYRNGFMQLWNEINAKRGFGWDVNPWVWVIEFRAMEGE